MTPTVTVGADDGVAALGSLIGALLPDPPPHADTMAAAKAAAKPRRVLPQNDIVYVPIYRICADVTPAGTAAGMKALPLNERICPVDWITTSGRTMDTCECPACGVLATSLLNVTKCTPRSCLRSGRNGPSQHTAKTTPDRETYSRT